MTPYIQVGNINNKSNILSRTGVTLSTVITKNFKIMRPEDFKEQELNEEQLDEATGGTGGGQKIKRD